MLDKWLRTLESYKLQAIGKVRESCIDHEIIESATKEIEVNCITVRNFLRKMYAEGYRLNEDISRVDEDYAAFEGYRRLMNHVEHHLWEIRQIPIAISNRNYRPIFLRYY